MLIVTSDDITNKLRNAIVSGDFMPNERLIEDDLATRFNTSRTPIREAMRNLATVGLVKIVPNKGAMVVDINIDEIKEIYQIRSNLEGLAVKLATKNIPEDVFVDLENMISKMEQAIYDGNRSDFEKWNTNFHLTIYSYSNNKLLYSMIRDLLDKSILFRRSAWISLNRIDAVMKAHIDLLNAIKERDEIKAQKISEDHIVLHISR